MNFFLYLFSKFKPYWIILKSLEWIKFQIGNILFKVYAKYRDFRRTLKNILDIVSLTVFDILLCLIFILSLYVIPSQFFNVDFIDPTSIGKHYVEILSVIAGIGGVIIGLFYAAILSLGTSTYSQLPHEAKDLLQKEPVGRVFIRLLSFLTFGSVTLIVLKHFGFEKSSIGIQIIFILTGVCIFAMAKLGNRLFYFTDPTLLAGSALNVLNDMIKMSKVGNLNWNNKSFQNYYNKRASVSLRTLKLLMSVAKNEKHLSSESFLSLAENSLSVLNSYVTSKSKIPIGSYFHIVKYRHKRWYEISDLSIDSYDILGHIPPEEERDCLWIERALSEIMLECIKTNLKNKNMDVVERGVNSLTSSIKLLIDNFEVEYGIQLLEELEGILLDDKVLLDVDIDNRLQIVGIIDVIGYARSQAILSGVESFKNFSAKVVKSNIDTIDWSNEKSIYSSGFPLYTHETLKFLQKTLEFEKSIEGNIVSSKWYIETLIFQKIIEYYKKLFSSIVDSTCFDLEEFKNSDLYKNLSKDKATLPFICSFLDRKLEHRSKLGILMNYFLPVWDELSTYNKIEDMPWPTLHIDNYKNKVYEWSEGLSEVISKNGALFNLNEYENDLPDYGGKFLHLVGNDILNFLLESGSLNENTFKSFHLNSLVMFDRLKKLGQDVPNWQIEGRLQVAVAPIIDLISLSGYVYILSEFYKSPGLWKIVTDCWDKYFENKVRERLDTLELIIKFPDQQFMVIPHRSFHRDKWEKLTTVFLVNELKVESEWYQPFGAKAYQERSIVDHDSKSVKAFLSKMSYGMGIRGEDIFIDVYLKDKALLVTDKEYQFSMRQGEFNRSIEIVSNKDDGGTDGIL